MALGLAIFAILISSCISAIRYSRDILHPAFWTSVAFLLYGVSFAYLYGYGIDGAVFLSLAGLTDIDADYLLLAAAAVLVGKFALDAPQRLVRLPEVCVSPEPLVISNSGMLALRALALSLWCVGFAYWIYVMMVLTGGSFDIFSGMAIWEYAIRDSGLTILPYHLAFVGCQLWFLIHIVQPNQSGWLPFLLYPTIFVMTLTTGRISASFMLVLIPVFFAAFVKQGSLPLKKMGLPLVLAAIAIVALYFYRSYSSYVYIDKSEEFLQALTSGEVKTSFLGQIVGSGNISDPQQLILLFDALNSGMLKYLYGETYFDWLSDFTRSAGPVSTGYRIHAVYFPDKSGGPTPGAIGEAVLNFGPLFFVPLVVAGVGAALFYQKARSSSSILTKFIYTKFLLHFWVLFIKVDSSLLSNLIWEVVPISLTWLVAVWPFKATLVRQPIASQPSRSD